MIPRFDNTRNEVLSINTMEAKNDSPVSGITTESTTQWMQCGAWKWLFEQGNIRYLSYGQTEVLRMIYPAVRDRAWLNVPGTLSHLNINGNEKEGYKIDFQIYYENEEFDLPVDFNLTLTSGGLLRFTLKGTSRRTCLKNRIGFCIHHPIEPCKGNPCTIFHPDGSKTNSRFPTLISPHQPFIAIAGMQWHPAVNCVATLTFSGDVFETEDQRNWTDASYKTYNTPLALPYPVTLNEGETVEQALELQVTAPANAQLSATNQPIEIYYDKTNSLPEIGFGLSPTLTAQDTAALNRLQLLQPDVYRVECYLTDESQNRFLKQASECIRILQIPVELVLFVPSGQPVLHRSFLEACKEQLPLLKRIFLLPGYAHSFEMNELTPWLQMVRELFPNTPVGSGTNANFAQLNRHRPDTTQLDFISYSIQPQEHASDLLSLTENLEGQAETLETALSFSNGKPVIVSPLTLHRRFNANIEYVESEESRCAAMVNVDQTGLYAAGWALGSLAACIRGGAHSVTFFEAWGQRGLLADKNHSNTCVWPVYWIFKWVLDLKKEAALNVFSSDPLKLQALCFNTPQKRTLLLANMTDQPVEVATGITGRITIQQLNSSSLAELICGAEPVRHEISLNNKLSLSANEVVRLEHLV